MNKPLKPIPKFASEAEERAFWETPDNDSTAYLDWSKAKRAVFPNLKPSTQAISLRLPVSLLSAIKVRANRMDVPYQSLIKTWLADKAAETYQRSASALPRQPRPWKAPKVKHAILPKAAFAAGQTLAAPILVRISGGPVVLIKICVPCGAARPANRWRRPAQTPNKRHSLPPSGRHTRFHRKSAGSDRPLGCLLGN